MNIFLRPDWMVAPRFAAVFAPHNTAQLNSSE
jgi:hypothetical protein